MEQNFIKDPQPYFFRVLNREKAKITELATKAKTDLSSQGKVETGHLDKFKKEYFRSLDVINKMKVKVHSEEDSVFHPWIHSEEECEPFDHNLSIYKRDIDTMYENTVKLYLQKVIKIIIANN